MTPLAYAKIGAAVLLVVCLFGGGFRVGSLSSAKDLAVYKTAVEAQHAAQLTAVVATMDSHDKQAAADRAAAQLVKDAYDLQKSLPPATAGLVERMRIVEAASCRAGNSVLPGAGPVAGGTDAASRVPGGDSEGQRLLQVALDKASSDALRLDALIKLKPKQPL